MNSSIILKNYTSLPEPKVSEIFRYLGVMEGDQATLDLISECIKEVTPKLSCRVVYREYDICERYGVFDLGFCCVCSNDLFKNLSGCKKIILFAATLGSEPDRLIYKYSRTSPSKAVVLDALASERIEALCDSFESEQKATCRTRARFSAGYGDLPLELQKNIFLALDCERKIGLTLNDSLLMSPSKSVTAIIGLSEK